MSPKICSSQPFWANYSCIYLRSRAISSPHLDPSHPPLLQCCPVPNLGPFMPTHYTVPPATQHSGHLPPADSPQGLLLGGSVLAGLLALTRSLASVYHPPQDHSFKDRAGPQPRHAV